MSGLDLQPSKLGTKEQFGVESVEKMVEWAEKYTPPTTTPSILEVGSGNGTLLLALLEANYPAKNLAGIDYSEDAVRLSKMVAASKDGEDITFSRCNFLTEDPPKLSYMGSDNTAVWDLLLDKGTYDAVALGQKDEQGKSPAAKYPARAARLIKPGGYFLITSCNFTEEELKANFVSEETGLQYHSRIQHPTFTFGGKSGSICCSAAFQKS
ncbi:n-lysine methyltransferase 1 [Moniliophthora roreri]|nr:n-lysine methyltransferase 1 [Moniliophthora roreri]